MDPAQQMISRPGFQYFLVRLLFTVWVTLSVALIIVILYNDRSVHQSAGPASQVMGRDKGERGRWRRISGDCHLTLVYTLRGMSRLECLSWAQDSHIIQSKYQSPLIVPSSIANSNGLIMFSERKVLRKYFLFSLGLLHQYKSNTPPGIELKISKTNIFLTLKISASFQICQIICLLI